MRVLLVFAAVMAVAFAAMVSLATGAVPPPVRSSSVDIFGQPGRSAEVAGRPLGRTLGVFRSSGLAARLPAPSGPMRPLASVAAHLRGNPGALIAAETRRVVTAAGPVYLVPTSRGWVCVQGPRFATCHRGLLRQGITWNFDSSDGGVDVIGIAADNVAAVALRYGRTGRRAELRHNVFFVERPFALTSVRHLPSLGQLVIWYRNGKEQESVPLN